MSDAISPCFSRPLRASFGFYFSCPPRRCGWPSDPSTRLSRRCSGSFLIHSWLFRARRCGWLSSPRGFITSAVARSFRLLIFLFCSGRSLYPSPPLWTVSHDETIDRRLRCGRCHDGSGPPLRKIPSSRPPIYFPPMPEVCFEPCSPLRVV